jgi:hypothetical protein
MTTQYSKGYFWCIAIFDRHAGYNSLFGFVLRFP